MEGHNRNGNAHIKLRASDVPSYENCLELQNQKILTDVSMKCQDGRIRVHHLVLGIQSPVLRSIFQEAILTRKYYDLKDQGHIPIDLLLQVSLTDLAALIFLVYTGHASLPTSKIPTIINIMDSLKIDRTEMVSFETRPLQSYFADDHESQSASYFYPNLDSIRPQNSSNGPSELDKFNSYRLRCYRLVKGKEEEGMISFTGHFSPLPPKQNGDFVPRKKPTKRPIYNTNK